MTSGYLARSRYTPGCHYFPCNDKFSSVPKLCWGQEWEKNTGIPRSPFLKSMFFGSFIAIGCPCKSALRPTHLYWLLQDSAANRADKVLVNIPLETRYVIPHVSSLKPRSWKQ